jgi:hypothetical protein
MKKLALILAILIAFAVPAMASDFSAGGQARFEAVDSDPGQGEDSKYFDQRYRVAFTWKVNDNVTTQLRADFAEFVWGDGYRPEAGNDTVMVDRAWAKVNQGLLTLTVGQQAGALGSGMVWSDQFQGILANLNFAPFGVNLLYVKESEGGALGNTVTDDNTNDDTDIYGINLTFANDMFSGGLIYAVYQNDGANPDDERKGYSAYFSAPVANFTLRGGIAAFSGEVGTTDYVGTQFFVGADTALTEALKVGLTFVWADDADNNETQLTTLQDDWAFNEIDFGGAMGYNNFASIAYGTGIFDAAGLAANNNGTSHGSMGIIGKVQYSVNEALTLWAKAAYLEPNDSASNVDSVTIAVANFDWVWVPSVTVSAGIGYLSPDYDDTSNDDSEVLTTMQLTVAF